MSGEFDLTLDEGQDMAEHQLAELVLWHRGYGLKLGFLHSEATLTANGEAATLVTALLRLALIGLRCRQAALETGNLQIVRAAEQDFRRTLS